jgi:hypothetical protein
MLFLLITANYQVRRSNVFQFQNIGTKTTKHSINPLKTKRAYFM